MLVKRQRGRTAKGMRKSMMERTGKIRSRMGVAG